MHFLYNICHKYMFGAAADTQTKSEVMMAGPALLLMDIFCCFISSLTSSSSLSPFSRPRFGDRSGTYPLHSHPPAVSHARAVTLGHTLNYPRTNLFLSRTRWNYSRVNVWRRETWQIHQSIKVPAAAEVHVTRPAY